MALTPGSELAGRYLIRDEIGRGGYSVVYRARDTVLDSDVAVKLLVPPPAIAEIARERMRREVKTARGLSHDNIVGVHDFLESEDACYVIMELIEGLDLARHVAKHGPMTADETARLGDHLAGALDTAHRQGVLHRDVKPQNVLIDRSGKAILADFGSAKLEGQATMTHTGGVVGTLAYLAPEILKGRRPDARADLYALGLTLYHALTGDMPARPASQMPPEPKPEGYRPSAGVDGVPEWLDVLIARLTSSEPHRRPATAHDVIDLIATRLPNADPEAQARCLLCGEIDPLSLNVCASCGTGTGSSDTLIFLGRGADRKARHRVAEALKRGAHGGAIPWVLRGSRALIRLPRDAANAVTRRMAEQGIPLRTMNQNLAWAPMPASYYLMAFTVSVTALWAGLSLSMVSLPLAALFICLGQLTLQRPAIRPQQGSVLPQATQAEVVGALVTLPPGTARDLLGDIVHCARLLYRSWGSEHPLVPSLCQSISAAVLASNAVSELDSGLALPEPAIEGADLEVWRTKRAGAEQTRDSLVQQMLQLDSALGYLQRRSAELNVNRQELAGMSETLARDGRFHLDAAREIEALLAPSPLAPSP